LLNFINQSNIQLKIKSAKSQEKNQIQQKYSKATP